ncbi:MAG TPA: metalloregulator ArsR/SmtB family transcription factor [Bryobacteraceae bacterium]|nr:metalloregulator ArsR/SmtB family transcription factor [Bryobacteraceae bacterium]
MRANRKQAELFAALGDETRLRLVSHLSSRGATSITRLTAGSGVTRQAITKHLGVMQRAGLVTCSRRGRESLWELRRPRIEDAERYLAIISKQWDAALERLKKFVEE